MSWAAPPGLGFLLAAWFVAALCALSSLAFASMALLGRPGHRKQLRFRRAGMSLLLVPTLCLLGFAPALFGDEGATSLDGAALLLLVFFAAGTVTLVYRVGRPTTLDG